MKNNIYRFTITFIICLQVCSSYAQTTNSMPPPLIRDRWDTLYAVVDYTNSSTFLYQHANLKMGNDMVILSDSGSFATDGSYFQIFNTTNNTLNTINFQRTMYDGGVDDGAVYTSGGTHHVFWGARNKTGSSTQWSLYKYSSSSNAITSETLSLPLNNHYGVQNVGFYSPTTLDDSMTIFVKYRLWADDSTYIYRKHYNQTGFITTTAKLPIKMDEITRVINFNNEMYIMGRDEYDEGRVFKSSDGITFTEATNYWTSYQYEWPEDADILNGKMYLGIRSSSQGFSIIETPDGANFSTTIANTNPFAVKSVKAFNNTIWYSYFEWYGSKSVNPSNSSTNAYAFDAPYVGYINMGNSTEVQSADTLGRYYHDGETFKLQVINSRLFLAGDYYVGQGNPGTFVYEFIPPVANFTMTGSNVCSGNIYTYQSQSVNADSVRWYLDNVNISTSSAINWSFTPGSHTLGLIAISGTQKDSLQYVFNSYAIGIVLNPAISACMNNSIPLTASLTAAVNPVTYTWSPQASLTQTSVSNPVCYVTAAAAATYTYDINITDANGCTASSQNNLVIIGSNKDITGTVDVSSTPLTSGNVILYKYEPFLTKFDSVTSQSLNASGTFTFTLPDAHTYILKCEPTSNTLQITYAPSEINWKTATVTTHGCSNNTIENISVIPLTNIGTGPGILSGKIVEGANYAGRGNTIPGNPIGGISVKGGKNPGGNISAQTITDAAGGYTFANMPMSGAGESYFILVDVAGLDTNGTYHTALTTSLSAITDLDFVIDSAKINPTNAASLTKQIKMDKNTVRIFPNPTNGVLNIQFELDNAQAVEIILNDITGKKVKTVVPAQQYFSRDFELSTDLGHNRPGIYMLRIKIGDIERVTRLVITE